MYVVPLNGEQIQTSDGGTYEVVSYTDYKPRGPALYCSIVGGSVSDHTPVVYFFDIVKIRGVHVEFDNSSKMFKASGKINRKFHLPQPGDKITVLKEDTPLDQPNDIIKVEKLKLHNKSEGINKGLVVCGDDACYTLADIIAINRQIGSDSFDRKRFLKLYKEYAGNSL